MIHLRIKLCPFFFNNKCKDGDDCNFAHGVSELRLAPSLKRTQMCEMWKRNKSCAAVECKFAHGIKELRSTSDFYKTKMCSFWVKGDCRYGDQCRHAHGSHELRSPPDDKNDNFDKPFKKKRRRRRRKSSHSESDATPVPASSDSQSTEWYVGCFDQHIYLPADVREAPQVHSLPDAGIDKLVSEPTTTGFNSALPTPVRFEIFTPPTRAEFDSDFNATPLGTRMTSLVDATPFVPTLFCSPSCDSLAASKSSSNLNSPPRSRWPNDPFRLMDDWGSPPKRERFIESDDSLDQVWAWSPDIAENKENEEPPVAVKTDVAILDAARALGMPFATLDDLLTFLRVC